MASANERKALWFLALVALSGSGVRLWRARSIEPDAAAASALATQLDRIDSARTREKKPARRRSGPRDTAASAPSIIDLDRATLAEIEGLPGIGPALARRIIAHRDSAGSFGAIESLCGVRGVGPRLVERLRPLVTFSGPRSPLSDECGAPSERSGSRGAAHVRKPS